MDRERFQEAEQAYAEDDFRTAARAFLEVASGQEDAGEALHLAGNALMRLGRVEDAATAYEHALEDEGYGRRGAVAANLGIARRKTGEPAEAVEAFDVALRSTDYSRKYKAQQGKAAALLDLGRLEEAAAAYRSAALDTENPDPGKALNNLGLTYMALGRPEDAVEAYESALGLRSYDAKGKAGANLGLALTMLGRYGEAVAAFDVAQGRYGFELSGGHAEAYRASTDAAASTVSGRDEAAETVPEERDPFEHIAEPETDFFTRTDSEMRRIDKETRRREREGRSRTRRWVVAGVAAALVLLLAAGLYWAYSAGYGFPTQRSTVAGMLDAYAESGTVADYWVAVPGTDVEQEMRKLPPNHESYTIDRVERGAGTSVVGVTLTLEQGTPLHYEFVLDREGVGWKVSGVDNDWRSTDGGG